MPRETLTESGAMLAAAYRQVLERNLADKGSVEGLKSWNKLKQVGQNTAASLNLIEQLTALTEIGSSQPFNLATANQAVESTLAVLKNYGRSGEFLRLIAADVINQERPEVSPQTQRVYQGLLSKPIGQLQVNITQLMTSNRVPIETKLAWFSAGILPAVQFLERLDKKEADSVSETTGNPSEDVSLIESLCSPPPDVRGNISVGMSEPPEFEAGKTHVHFTVAPYSDGYHRCTTYDLWNDAGLSFSKSKVQMKPVAENFGSPTSLKKIIHGFLSGEKIIGLPIKPGYRPVSIHTKTGETLKIMETPEGDFLLDGSHLSSTAEFWVEEDKAGTENKCKREAKLINDFSSYEISKDLENLLRKWKKESKTQAELAGKILHWVKTNFTYSNDPNASAWYKQGGNQGFFARIEEKKLADCDVANTFFIFLLGRLGIPAMLIDGYYVNKKAYLSSTAVLGSHNPHAWTLLWDGLKWIEADATPSNGEEEGNDQAENQESQPGEDEEETLAEILSAEEIEQIIKDALEEIEREERGGKEKIEEFAKEAGCDHETAAEIIKRLEEARLKKDKNGRLLQGRMRDAWMKLERKLEIPKIKTRKVRLSEGGELDDEVELTLDLLARESDPGGFVKKEKRITYKPVFDGIDVYLVADKSLSMNDPNTSTGKPKRLDQQTLGFLLLDSLHSAAKMFAKRLGKRAGDMEIRSSLITFGAVDKKRKVMINPKVELPLSTAWGPKEQLVVYQALEENFGGSTPDYAGLNVVRQTIETDQKNDNKQKKHLRLVLLVTDGGSDSANEAKKEQQKLENGGHLLRAAGIGPDAVKVPQTYGTAGSHLPTFDDAYEWLTEEVIEAANRLIP